MNEWIIEWIERGNKCLLKLIEYGQGTCKNFVYFPRYLTVHQLAQFLWWCKHKFNRLYIINCAFGGTSWIELNWIDANFGGSLSL